MPRGVFCSGAGARRWGGRGWLGGAAGRCAEPLRERLRSCDEGYFANLMLPEGAHHREEDTTHFFLYREGRRRSTANGPPPGPADLRSSGCASILSDVFVRVLSFDTNHNDWVGVDADLPWCKVIFSHSESSSTMSHFRIIDPADGDRQLHRLRIHSSLQYTRLTDSFSSVYNEKDEAIGLRFKSPIDMRRFESVVLEGGSTTAGEEENAVAEAADSNGRGDRDKANAEDGTFLYCVNLVRTKRRFCPTRCGRESCHTLLAISILPHSEAAPRAVRGRSV